MTTALTIVDLQTNTSDEPRVLDVRLGEALGMVRPGIIRASIEANRREIEGLGTLHAARATSAMPNGGSKVITQYYLNEAQALLLCMFARTSRAVEVRRQVIEVFMAWRHGDLEPVAAPNDLPSGDLIKSVRHLRAGGMFKVEEIAGIHGMTVEAVRALSDDCAPPGEPCGMSSRYEVSDRPRCCQPVRSFDQLRRLHYALGKEIDALSRT